MEPVLESMLALMVVSIIVLFSYALLYFKYVGSFGFVPYNDLERRLLWAIYYEGWPFRLWLISCTLSAIAFVFFSIWMQTGGYPSSSTDDPSWVVYPYALFFVFSFLYAPLLVYLPGYRIVVLVVLFCAGTCSVILFVWTAVYLDMSVATNVVLTLFMAWLAIHCVFLDLVWWGYTWYFDMYWNKEQKFVSYVQGSSEGESVNAPIMGSSGGTKTNSQWPKIEYSALAKDVRLVRTSAV
jgi:hypothetical protein